MAKYERNAFKKFDCPQPGCDRTGDNGFSTGQSLGMHRMYNHGYRVNKDAPKITRKYTRRNKNDNGHNGAIVPRGGASAAVIAGRMAGHFQSSLPAMQAQRMNYCPCCGFDLMALLAHMAIDTPVTIRRCPQCKINLAVVEVALSVELQSIDPEHARLLIDVVQKVAAG